MKFGKSPIIEKRRLKVSSADNQKIRNEILSKFGEIIFQKGFISDKEDEDEDIKNLIFDDDEDEELKNNEKNQKSKNKKKNGNKFQINKFADFSPSIVDNYYTFTQEKIINDCISENNISSNISNNISHNISINDISIEEEKSLCNHNEDLKKHKSNIILNPKISNHLPTDIFYE